MENKPVENPTEPKKEETPVQQPALEKKETAPAATTTATPEAKPESKDDKSAEKPGDAAKPGETKSDDAKPGETLVPTDEAAKVPAGLGKTAIDFSFYKVRKSITSALNKSPKARTYTVMILTLVTVIFFVAFTIIPTVSTIGSIRSEIARKEEVFNDLDRNIETIETLEAKELANPDDFKALKAAAPSDFEQNLFSDQIQTISVEHGLEFDSVRFSSNISNQVNGLSKEFRKTEVTIIVRGSVSDFVAFLGEVENLNRLLTVTTIDYSLNDESSSASEEFILIGDIYNVKKVEDWDALEESRDL